MYVMNVTLSELGYACSGCDEKWITRVHYERDVKRITRVKEKRTR